MALSNWLTRDEWNAVYFMGFKESVDGKECADLGQQMCLGIGLLHRKGYKFKGITSYPDGNYEKETQCCVGNETVLAEMIGGYGGFDRLARAKETISFVEKALPSLDIEWLKEAIKGAGQEDKAR